LQLSTPHRLRLPKAAAELGDGPELG
jgi:hypothetical protein